jgi:hypothetical protein
MYGNSHDKIIIVFCALLLALQILQFMLVFIYFTLGNF